MERMKALVYFGNNALTLKVQDLLRNSIAKHSQSPLKVKITKLRVIQGYGYSLSKQIGSGLAVELISNGYLGEQRMKQGSDVVFCIAEGSLNGKSFKTGSMVPYKLNPFSSPVWNDEAAIKAARKAIDEAALRIFEKTK